MSGTISKELREKLMEEYRNAPLYKAPFDWGELSLCLWFIGKGIFWASLGIGIILWVIK